ncbi:MAG: AarF/ABC1/UbiB kinase family protein, partial [Alphaproteobacteria bacterium]|nr:AarF/ABC1/UbiB kinase family protein [Alphaproteobacteria bacterium]
GLGGVFMHLKAEINWYRLFHDLIEDFDIGRLRRRQSRLLRKYDLPLP